MRDVTLTDADGTTRFRGALGGPVPQVEVFTVTAAQVHARWDAGAGASYVEVTSFAAGDTVALLWYTSTLNVGVATAGVYLDSPGRTSAQVNADSDISIPAVPLDFVGTFAVQFDTTPPGVPLTLVTAACAGYLSVDADSATGAVELSMLTVRAS